MEATLVCDHGRAAWHDPVQREPQPVCGTFWKFLFPSDFTCDPGSYHGHCEDITVSVEAFG